MAGLTRLPSPVIPVTDQGWLRSVADAQVHKILGAITELTDVVGLASSDGGFKQIRKASELVRRRLEAVLGDLWCLSAFRPARDCGVAELYDATHRIACLLIEVLEGEQVDGLRPATEEISEAVDCVLAAHNSDGNDTWVTAFDVTGDELVDTRGAFVPSRLLAAFHNRYLDLQRRFSVLFSPVSDAELPLEKAPDFAHALIDAPYPLVTLRTATGIRSVIAERFVRDPDGTARPLRELLMRVDRSYASHLIVMRLVGVLAVTESLQERTLLQVDLYRRMIEGQLRPWAWTLLRLLGRTDGRIPEIAQLRDQLIASKDRLAADAAQRLIVAARNVAAHEDYVWDEKLGALVIGDDAITEGELKAETERAYSFMCGAETGWAFSRAESPELTQLLDLDRATKTSVALSSRAATAYYGTNGLRVTRWSCEQGKFSVELEHLDLQQVNPCIQATMWAAQHLRGVQRFTLNLADHTNPVLEVGREILDAIFPHWLFASQYFNAMPPPVFDPVLTAARLVVECPSRAAEAAVWFALNNSIHAYCDLHEQGEGTISGRLLTLSRLLKLSSESLRVSESILPTESDTLLGRPFRLIHAAAIWARSGAQGHSLGPSAKLEERIRDMYNGLESHPLLPTLDPSPLG